MKRKTLRQLLCTGMSIGLVLACGMSAWAAPANDVGGHWAEKQLKEWLSKGYIQGYEDGSVQPDKAVTRAEFLALINRSFGLTGEAAVDYPDVTAGSWQHAEVAKALKAGYVSGYEDHTFRPSKPISRQEAAAIIAKLVELPAPASAEGALNAFKDAGDIADWSKPAVAAVVEKGLMDGYEDRSYRPNRSITRAEAVATLNAALETRAVDPSTVVYGKAGVYGPETGSETIAGDVVIEAAGITLRNVVVEGDLTVAAGVGGGDATLDNVTVKGTTRVHGGGEHSVHFNNTVLATVVVDKKDGTIRIVAEGSTRVETVTVLSPALVEEAGLTSDGFVAVKLADELPADAKVTLIGKFDSVDIQAASIAVEVPQGSVGKLNVAKEAGRSSVKLGEGTTVAELVLNAVLKVLGQGTIQKATANEGSQGSSFEKKPAAVEGAQKDAVASGGNAPAAGGTTSGGGSDSGGSTTDDQPPAAPAVTGVTEGATYASAAPTWSEVAGVTIAATLAKDGGAAEPYAKGTPIEATGSYTLVVTATKASNGMTAKATVHFAVDADAPAAPVVAGVTEGETYASAAPTWSEVAGVTSAATLAKDGGAAEPYASGTPIEATGSYELVVTATKASNGKTAAATVAFKVDADLPAAPVVTGVTEGATYVSATPAWTDAAGVTSAATLSKNGGAAESYASGTPITATGSYELVVTATKASNGKTASTTVSFKVDAEAPAAPVVKGVTEGATYASATPAWSEIAGVTSAATLSKDGRAAESYASGTPITATGSYELIVTATKTSNGLTASTTVTFSIDADVPAAPVVTGVTEGATYVSATPAWTDATGTTSTATLAKNGGTAEPYASGTPIAASGSYVLEVTATKTSNGKTATTTVSFKVDAEAPAAPVVTGVTEGATYASATPAWTDAAGTTSTATLTKNGGAAEPYTSGTPIAATGTYALEVTATKTSNGLTASTTVTFTVDAEAPAAPVVTGVTEGATYASATPTWTDAAGTTSTATLTKNGGAANPYAKGTPITETGTYALEVTASKTSNGLTATTTVTFAVDAEAPATPSVTGVTYGLTYASATPTWTDEPGTTSTATLSKDGGAPAAYTSGTTIDADGSYVLVVTATKTLNGLTATTTIPFTIDTVPPARPTVTGVTYSVYAPTWTDVPGVTITAVLEKDNVVIPFAKGDTLTDPGHYKLTVTARKESNGLEDVATYEFTI
ncbi:S-layer homology domain-containing protein [Paenibacillus flagellatus]|nr:S-layer homology domain-containing protein [Paenibacillus flagellatus]